MRPVRSVPFSSSSSSSSFSRLGHTRQAAPTAAMALKLAALKMPSALIASKASCRAASIANATQTRAGSVCDGRAIVLSPAPPPLFARDPKLG